MADREAKYRAVLVMRNIWLFTLAGVLVVFAGLFGLALEPDRIDFGNILEYHKMNPIFYLFDALPLFIFIILYYSRVQMLQIIEESSRDLAQSREILSKNSEYAQELSEGEDPDVFPGMLNSDLGQALKLIQLNIKSNRRKERELTWITEGKDMISRILRVYNEIDELSEHILQNLTKFINATQGAVYLFDKEKQKLRNVALLAYNRKKYVNQEFGLGEGLVGQCAFEMDYIYRTEIPDDYATITSGLLGDQKPRSILLVPLITNQELQGVMEFAFMEGRVPKLNIQFLLELGEIIARTFYNLQVNERTRVLLEESREMTSKLQKNEQVLQENAQTMKATQEEIQQANKKLKKKIQEAENAQLRLHWLLENASEVISIYDKNIQLSYISPSAERILGYSAQEMMQGKDFERIDQKGSIGMRKAFEELSDDPDRTVSIEYSFVKRDGSRLYMRSTIKNLLEDPSINGFIVNSSDITESRMIEKEQRLKSRMQSLSENSLDLILRISNSGTIYYTNPVIEDYAGVRPSELINKNLEDTRINKVLMDVVQEALHRVSQTPVKFSLEESIPIDMGGKRKERILNFNIIPEFQENELETVLFVGHDITEAKRIEKEIQVTNRKVQDSINYAERIQSSILPSARHLEQAFPNSFIFYKPKDVISGDFPWFFETDQAWYIAAIDCTGHGVPGALLSFIGFFLLNNIVALNPEKSTGEIADLLHEGVRKTLKQDRGETETRDGMDLALCKVSKQDRTVEFTGAHRPLYLLSQGEITMHKGDRKAIGGILNPRKPDKPFTTSSLKPQVGDKLFIFSDGLTDQMGGPKNTKYSPSRLREILLNNPGFTMAQFEEYIVADFNSWMGHERQLDDVLLIGLEF